MASMAFGPNWTKLRRLPQSGLLSLGGSMARFARFGSPQVASDRKTTVTLQY